MKWIKLLEEYDGRPVGDTFQVEDLEAKTLLKMKKAEETTEPESVQKTVGEAKAELGQLLATAAKEGAKEAAAELLAEVRKMAPSVKRPHISGIQDNEDADPTFGFKNIGDQFRNIAGWYKGDNAARNDERMKRVMSKAPTTYANEGTGADGGALLAPNFSNEVLMHSFGDEALFTRTDTYTTGSNSLTIPKDETTPWGTNGVQVYWTAEAGQATQSKPKLGQDNLQLQKLTALVPCTDEQLSDSFVGLGQYVSKQAGDRIRFAVDEAIVNGTGVGKPLGIINSGALISQAAEGSQTASTINITNIAKMVSRIPAPSLQNLVWLVHPSAFPQLVVLSNANTSLYVGPGQVEDKKAVMGRLMGIPLIISQHCQSIGTPGDIYLFDLTKYITLTKGDGIQSAMSIHLFFDYNVSTFRFNFRVAGQPWLQAPITSLYGSYQLSPFVDLASR